MSKRSPTLLLQDMLESAQKIKIYTADIDYDNFLKDEKTKDAVARNFEIIGEAANRLPSEFKDKHPEIKWNRIRGFRNRIVHHYFGIDFEIVWSIIENDLKFLIKQLSELLEE